MDNKLESYITKLLLFCYLIKHLSNYIFDNKYIKSYIYLKGNRQQFNKGRRPRKQKSQIRQVHPLLGIISYNCHITPLLENVYIFWRNVKY